MINYNNEMIEKNVLARVKDEIDFPEVILIDTISYCNLKCSMCPHKDMNRKPGIMSWDLYKKIVDEIAIKNPHAQIWITFFGEGLILKDLPEKIKYARDKGLTNICLNSNGNLLRKDVSVSLIKAGLNNLYVGIDAFKADTYVKNRVNGDYETVVNGVLEYKKLLDEVGKPDQGVIVQFVEMDNNKSEEEEFIAFWNKHNINVKIRPMVSWANAVTANNLSLGIKRMPCYWAMNTINIIDSGEVAMCSVDLQCDVPMGNIKNESIYEVWNNQLRKFRTLHRVGKWESLPEKCANCCDWQSGYAVYQKVDE